MTIYSDEVGRFSDDDLKLLENVAGDIGFALDNLDKEFQRKLAEDALQESEVRLDLAIRSAHMGVWSWNILEDKRRFDLHVCRLLGIDPAAFTGKG